MTSEGAPNAEPEESPSTDSNFSVQTIMGGDRDALARGFETFYQGSPPAFGAADIIAVSAATHAVRAAMLAVALCGFVDQKREPIFLDFLVIIPPGGDPDVWLGEYWEQFRKTFTLLAGREMSKEEDEARFSQVRLERSPDLRISSLLDLISKQPERTAIIVSDATVYRDESVQSHIEPGDAAPTLNEDFWVPQVHALAAQSMAAIEGREIYLAIDTGEANPRRKALNDLLNALENCIVLGSTNEESADHILAGRVEQWERWLREGRVGRALQDVEALPEALDTNKLFLRIQLLNRAGLTAQALQLIHQELDAESEDDPFIRTKLARIAEDGNASRLAAQLLDPAIDQLVKREHLATALGVACDIGDPALEAKVVARLDMLFPGDKNVARRRLHNLVEARDYAGASAHAAEAIDDPSVSIFYAALDRYLSGPDVPDYAALIAEGNNDQAMAEAFRMAGAEDARTRGLAVHAFDLAMPLPVTDKQIARGERLMLLILKDLALAAGSAGKWPIDQARIEEAILALLRRLADDPSKGHLRIGVAELFEPAIAGSEGHLFLIAIILKMANRPVKPVAKNVRGSKDMVWLREKEELVRSIFRWIKTEEPAIIGRLIMPPELLTEPADDLLSGLASYLDFAPFGGPADEQGLNVYLLMASAVAPYSSDPDFDLELLRLVAGKFASGGSLQASRDLVEQALINGAASARRRRLAWFAVADTYSRAPNLVEGALALACTWLASDETDYEQMFQEMNLLARLLREFGLLALALDVAARARDVLQKINLADAYGYQVDTLELQIRHRMLRSADDGETIGKLLADTTRNAAETLERNALPAPVAAMLGQLLRLAKQSGAAIPDDAEDIFEKLLERMQGSARALLAAMAAETPSTAEIAALVKAAEKVRYSADMGFDIRNLAIVASRALGDDGLLDQPEEVSFLLDLGADIGVALPNWDDIAAPAPLPKTMEETAKIAADLSKNGISVLQAGFDEQGRLVRVSAVAGTLEKAEREPSEVINEQRLRDWSREFPYAYGIDEDTANLFYTTTADLRFSKLPDGPTLVVAEAVLQTFPPNLLFVDGDFSGRTRPMAAAPSLAWLGAARKIGAIGDGRLCSWISTADEEGQTLAMIADRLADTFEDHGFLVDNGPTLPARFAGATLAVVTAHGGVSSEHRYFQMVSDEGVLRVSAAELANALRNVGVVILFVCSGGRADKHPGANTTLGLAKQILDRGCTAVIASPWPLDARVPSHWLPAFMDKWTSGERLVEACYEANKVVDANFASDPARGLAMSLFGNPEILFTPPAG